MEFGHGRQIFRVAPTGKNLADTLFQFSVSSLRRSSGVALVSSNPISTLLRRWFALLFGVQNLLLRLDLQCDWFISAKAYQNFSLMEFLLEAFHLVRRERAEVILRQSAHEKRPKNTAIAALHAAVEVHI